MKLVNNIPALEFPELQRAGISEGTLKSALHRDSDAWPFFKDMNLSKHLLIFWHDIREKYRQQIEKAIGNPYELAATETITPYLICPEQDRETLNTYTDEFGRPLTIDQVRKYSAACAYLNLVNTISKEQYKRMGFPSRSDFDRAISSLIRKNDICLPSHPKSLLRKLKEYREIGAIAVISGHVCNQSSRVLTDDQQRWLMAAYADPRKPTVDMVYSIYTAACSDRGWKAASKATVKAFLADKRTRQVVEIERDPKIWKDKFGFTITTAKPTMANALWEGDGTKNNLFYRDETGKIKSDLQVYFVVDVATEVILGVSFGYSEKKEVALNAWRMAIKTADALPKQTRFDNGGAHRSQELSEFMSRLSEIHFKAMAYNGQSKYIEGIIGRFQSKHLRLFNNFTGMNIRAKKDDSRVNESWIKSNPDAIPSLRESMAQTVQAVEAWNYDVNRRGRVRMEMYRESIGAGRAITQQDRVHLLYEDREACTYRKDGIKLIHQGEQLLYNVFANGSIDLDFHLDNVNRSFAIKWNPEDTSHIYLLDEKRERIIARADSRILVPGSVNDYTEGSRELINAGLNMKKQQTQRLLDTVAELKSENLIDLTHDNLYKDALNRAESNYLSMSIAESAPAPKPIGKKDIMLPDEFQEGGIINDEDEF